MATSLRRMAALVPRCVRHLQRRSITRGEAVGSSRPGGTWRGTEPRDCRRDTPPYRQTELEDPYQRSGRTPPGSASAGPGGGYPPGSTAGAAVAAALATAADHGGGHDPGPGGQGPDVRRRVRLD